MTIGRASWASLSRSARRSIPRDRTPRIILLDAEYNAAGVPVGERGDCLDDGTSGISRIIPELAFELYLQALAPGYERLDLRFRISGQLDLYASASKVSDAYSPMAR